ncbi:hypothetical protein Tcan_14846 [Toxocara canis]|uniref:Uncharacterized protein n=1 Tax=Toxocara canis TaxID=6265 RepID=A0A0B2VKJ2_TOXCA|nr:hypothetical protein Tcan_14846 [Toxocara canis]
MFRSKANQIFSVANVPEAMANEPVHANACAAANFDPEAIPLQMDAFRDHCANSDKIGRLETWERQKTKAYEYR